MITGVVNTGEGRIRLKVRGTREREAEIDAVVDTGYDASLTLPSSVIAALGLTWDSAGKGVLADGNECLFDVYEGIVIWDRQALQIFVDQADADPLVGMGLMNGYELKMQVRPNGKVVIKRLPRRGGEQTLSADR